jgi:hypothetical protein
MFSYTANPRITNETVTRKEQKTTKTTIARMVVGSIIALGLLGAGAAFGTGAALASPAQLAATTARVPVHAPAHAQMLRSRTAMLSSSRLAQNGEVVASQARLQLAYHPAPNQSRLLAGYRLAYGVPVRAASPARAAPWRVAGWSPWRPCKMSLLHTKMLHG